MKYPDGKDIHIGDKVFLWEGCSGIIVANIYSGEYGDGYPKNEWEYLKGGVLIESDKAGLIHYLEPEKGMRLIERSK